MPRKKASHRSTRPPLTRMLHIHAAIQAEKFPTANTLARELEVCSRSVGRDIEFMRDSMDLPIVYDDVKHGYYYSEEVSAFPSLVISEGELLALAVAEKAMHQYRGTSFEKPLMSALQKLAESLPDTISLNLGQWNDSISFRTSAEAIIDLGLFDLLTQATAKREQLKIVYRKPGERKPETRIVDPYHMANVNGEWFLFGWDHLRQAIRTFSPARMVVVETTGKVFPRNKSFSIEKELQNSFGVYSGTGEYNVVIRFNEKVADYIREKKWHPSQRLKEMRDGGVELRMKLSSLVEVERWVLAWGGNARVVSPPELARNVHSAADKIRRTH